ncbi:hypothetical protein RvY_11478 [Ramazzottius varieornatus]|uniref:Uncharacterized protein n=1 Tax=Ramazzottius varieornatus TaxID=947166 RepID=A0A1D1VQ31_RAMVA|nr:hypothetical protein RvY_11478 [Ramazzottius varieornatus]
MPELYNMLMAAPKAASSAFMKPVSEDSLDRAPWPTEKHQRDGRAGSHKARKYALEDDVAQEPSDKPIRKRRKTKIKDLDTTEASLEGGRNKDSTPMKRWRVKTVIDTHIEIMEALSASTINT